MVKNTKTKKEIRKQVLRMRSKLPMDIWKEKSEELMKKIIEHPLFQNAATIYGYLSYSREVDTWALLSYALESGKNVAVPKVLGTEMEFYYIENLQEVQAGIKGIYEPVGDADRLAKDEYALIIMPVVGFDKDRTRIGYGGGYYDKYLQKHPKHPTMGIAFSLQETEPIPTEETDWKPDIIVTETKEVRKS